MRRWLVRLGVVAALVAAVLVLRVTVLAPEPLQVEVVEVGRGQVEETVTNSRAGTVKARRRAHLSPELGGQVVAIPHREGEWVKAGELLLQLDDSSQRAALELTRRDLQVAAAEEERACLAAERAGRELARMRRLAEDEIVSTDLLDEVESGERTAAAACEAARAGRARAGAAVAVARTEIEKTALRAPFDGIVAEVAIEVGEWTTPSPPALPVPPVIDVLDPSSLHVSAPMDEVDAGRLRAGQPARVSVDSHRDRTFDGVVERVAPYVLDVEEQNRTVEVEVALESSAPAQALLPGTSADVEVILEVREEVLRIPTSALLQGGRVFVLEEGRIQERRVETGLRNWDFTEIRSGLEAGDRVVTSLDRAEVEPGALAEAADGAGGP